MQVIKTEIDGVLLIERNKNVDNRGYFERIYSAQYFSSILSGHEIKQINRSYNKKKGTIRGMHFQSQRNNEFKFISCISGAIFDVILDLRCDSPTFSKYLSFEISAASEISVLCPPGCAHGFQTMEDNTELLYFHTAEFDASCDYVLNCFDKDINILWPLSATCMSDRDQQAGSLANFLRGGQK